MADMVTCKVHMTGIAREDLFSKYPDGSIYFDLDKIIPEPKVIEDCPEKYRTTPETTCCETYPDRPWFDWYNWHCDYWDTKWNTFDTMVLDDDCVQFLTAWRCLEKVMVALSKKHPDKVLCVKFAKEYDDVSYEIRWQDGERLTAIV